MAEREAHTVHHQRGQRRAHPGPRGVGRRTVAQLLVRQPRRPAEQVDGIGAARAAGQGTHDVRGGGRRDLAGGLTADPVRHDLEVGPANPASSLLSRTRPVWLRPADENLSMGPHLALKPPSCDPPGQPATRASRTRGAGHTGTSVTCRSARRTGHPASPVTTVHIFTSVVVTGGSLDHRPVSGTPTNRGSTMSDPTQNPPPEGSSYQPPPPPAEGQAPGAPPGGQPGGQPTWPAGRPARLRLRRPPARPRTVRRPGSASPPTC